MQTKDMKKDYEVAVLDPAGNVTAIVLSDVPAAERARAAARLLRLPELHIEQVAFLTAPRCGGEIRLAYESDGTTSHPTTSGSLSARYDDVLKNLTFSKETQQINNLVVPCAVLLRDVTVAGE